MMNADTAVATSVQRKKPPSNFKLTCRRFAKSKIAMIALAVLVALALMAIFADVITTYPYDQQDLTRMLEPPSRDHIFGTDNFGRDLFSRVVYGSRISLIVGFLSVSISLLVGCTVGAIAAYYGGRADMYIMRVLDVLQSIPSMMFAIAIAASLGTGLTNAMIAIGVTYIPLYARITRASVMSVKETEYIEAAKALGASDAHIIIKHMIPNSMAPIIVQASLSVAQAVLQCASLSFIGLGVQPPTPEWGSILAAARSYLNVSWHFVLFPGVAIIITVIAINLVGDGLRDALDPRLK